jgi:hypothetical protein
MTLLGAPVVYRLVANFIDRIDSAKGDKGSSIDVQQRSLLQEIVLWPATLVLDACLRLRALSSGTMAKHGIWSDS